MLIFKIVLAILGPLTFHINFRVFSHFYKNVIWIWVRIVLALGSMDI